jgi:hypothetical protein
LHVPSNNAPFVENGLKSTTIEAIAIAEMTPNAETVGSCKMGATIGRMAARIPVVEAKDDTTPPTYR